MATIATATFEHPSLQLFKLPNRDSPLPLWTVMATMDNHGKSPVTGAKRRQALDFDRDSPCFLGRLSGNATCTQYLLHGQRQGCWMFCWGESGFVLSFWWMSELSEQKTHTFFWAFWFYGHFDQKSSHSVAPWRLDRISGSGTSGTSATLREELAALRFRKPTDAPRRMHFGQAMVPMCQDLAKSLKNTGLKSDIYIFYMAWAILVA